MARRSIVVLCLVLLPLAAASTVEAQEPQPPPSSLDDALRAALGTNGLPEDAALWIGRASGGVGESYYGRYDRGTVVPLSSASQWLAAATLVRLVDGGLLSLDDPLLEFFPRLDDEKIAITLRQLLSHTSGLVTHHPCLADDELSLELCAERILDEPRVARPGAQLRYGAASYQVAGRIAEIVTGETWQEVFSSAIALPLGLESTGWAATRNPPIATGAHGSARDYGRFLSMLLARGEGPSGRVLEEASVEEMLSPQTRRARIVLSPTGEESAFGLGAWLEEIEGSDAMLASSPAVLGFSPWLDAEHDLAGVLMIIHRRRDLIPLVAELQRLAAESTSVGVTAEPRPEGAVPDAAAAAEAAGRAERR